MDTEPDSDEKPTLGVDAYQVVGNPVEHSLSPRIHQAFARQVGADLVYTRCRVETGQLSAHVQRFISEGGLGMNVTVPFKTDAFALADQCDVHARVSGAANTLHFVKHEICAFNTDGIGLVRDLTQRHGLVLEGKRILILGAGGAARGVVLALLAEQPASLWVSNRTHEKAEQLVADLTQALRAHAQEIPDIGLHPQKFAARPLQAWQSNTLDESEQLDLIINATAAGLGDEPGLTVNPDLLADARCYDMSYGSAARFAAWAAEHGARVSLDGLGMLVEQAAESFYIWRNEQVETQPVYTALRAHLNG